MHIRSITNLQSLLNRVQSKNGVVIDCVYIHKQPTLKHPLFKDHKIQVGSSSVLYSPVLTSTNIDCCGGQGYAHDCCTWHAGVRRTRCREEYRPTIGRCQRYAAAASRRTHNARVASKRDLSCGNSPHPAVAEGHGHVGPRRHAVALPRTAPP